MTNIYGKIAGIGIVGLSVIGACAVVSAIVEVVKTKKALKGINEQLEVVDELIDKAEEMKVQEEIR